MKDVIIFGGGRHDSSLWGNEIFIWNMKSMVISKCDINCPDHGLFAAVIMPNHEIFLLKLFDGSGHWKIDLKQLVKDERLIVDGYLRIEFENKIALPREICELIYHHFIRFTNIP